MKDDPADNGLKPVASARSAGTPHIACVVIGRNEGGRLLESLRSVQAAGLPTVYVDSGSSDGSSNAARELGVRSIDLEPSQPFSAARARNRGLDEVMNALPDTQYVIFLDGDCTLEPSFPEIAARHLDQDGQCAIVTGHLSEQHPDQSIYNRLCAIEWRSPAGRMEGFNALGGIMAVRASAYQAVGGFNPKAVAGEEADLAIRLRAAGYAIVKVDAPMAIHDARILTFRQWWIRAVRGGHAFTQGYALHGGAEFPNGRRAVLSALFWGLALPALILLTLYPSRGVSVLLLGGYLVLGLRMFRHYRAAGLSPSDALLAARFGLYAKFAHVIGIFRFWMKGAKGPRIIEYK